MRVARPESFASFAIAIMLAAVALVYVSRLPDDGRAYRAEMAVLNSADSVSDKVSGQPQDATVAVAAAEQPKDEMVGRIESAPRVASQSFNDGYRTMCVRLCDGYYFPISTSTTADAFERDETMCKNSCSSPAKLFYFRNRDGSPEDMVDRDGRPYLGLSTAFQHRTTYDASCNCRPDPWTQEAFDLHRLFALREQDKSDPAIRQDLAALETKVQDQQNALRARLGAEPIHSLAARPERKSASATVALKSGRSITPSAVAKIAAADRVWSMRARRGGVSMASKTWRARGFATPGQVMRVRVSDSRVTRVAR